MTSAAPEIDLAESLPRPGVGRALEVFLVFLRLGCTSFGGPIAHLGYFREEFVARRRWIDERTYAHIIALCQFLPGPASSQVGIIIGLSRADWVGAIAAWTGFTLPSAAALTAFAYGLSAAPSLAVSPVVHGLIVAAVAVVAAAVLGMARTLCPDRPRQTLALITAGIIVFANNLPAVQFAVLALAALYGWRFLREQQGESPPPLPVNVHPAVAIVAGTILVLVLGASPLLAGLGGPIGLFARFFYVGSLVFGGGHVVLPMLQAQVVPPGWISNETFLAGYGAAQAVPGPLFTFAAYLGAAMNGPVWGLGGACVALLAIFLPSFLLIGAILPFWNRLQAEARVVAALAGVNAAVVGLLAAALYSPIWTSAIRAPRRRARHLRIPPTSYVEGAAVASRRHLGTRRKSPGRHRIADEIRELPSTLTRPDLLHRAGAAIDSLTLMPALRSSETLPSPAIVSY